MKKILYFAAVLSAFMTSCNSENEIIDNNPAKGTSTITATFDQPASRVQMGTSDGTHTPLQWNAGDQLAVYNVTSCTFGKYEAASSVADGDLSAVFNFVAQAGTNEIIPAEAHLAAYPYARIAAGNFEFEYQTTQTYTENSFDRLAMPMVASNASGTEFSFKAQAAVLRLKVSTTESDVTVNSIDIESASMALTGDALPNMTLGTYGVPTANTGKTVTLNCTTPVAINGTPTVFNIVVPGQTYPSGDLTITVKTNKGDFAKTSKADATFEAGKVYNLTISGVPVASTVPVTAINFGIASLNLELDEVYTITPEVLPNNATDNTLTWSSNKVSVATVVDGVVTAVGVGNANITATANDGSGVTTTIPVTVTPGEVVFDKNNSNIIWNGSGSSTLSAYDNKSHITLTLTRSNGNITRVSNGTITFQSPQANNELTVTVTGRNIVSVTNSATNVTLNGNGPWTLTYKTTATHSVTSNGWYTSGGVAFIVGSTIPGAQKLTVVYQ